MINVDFVNIDNAKIIGRLLPFWARGKNVSLLMQAILSPIVSVHNNFKLWALERYIYAHITSQAMSIEWYLKYKLKSHFVNGDHSFIVSDEPIDINAGNGSDDGNGGGGGGTIPDTEGVADVYTCFGGEVWVNEFVWKNNVLWSSSAMEGADTHSSAENDEGADGSVEKGSYIYVYAPEIVSTINYNRDDYIRDINYIVSQFMTNFKEIKIIIINK